MKQDDFRGRAASQTEPNEHDYGIDVKARFIVHFFAIWADDTVARNKVRP